MEKNELVLGVLYDASINIQGNVFVNGSDLIQFGWEGRMPTEIFTKFPGYWVRLVKQTKKFKIVKIESYMLAKKETAVDENAPLPISNKGKFNLKDLYKDSLKEKK